MTKKKVGFSTERTAREQIEKARKGFCQVFHGCADRAIEIIKKDPGVIPYPAKDLVAGSEGDFIATFCMQNMGKTGGKSDGEIKQMIRDTATALHDPKK